MDNSQNIFGRTCYGWSNFYLIREYQKVLPIYVGKIKFQGTLFMKWQFLIQVTGRKWKKNSKYFRFSWKLWWHNLIWFDMFFWRKNACILLTVRHFSEIRSLCLMKSSCKKKLQIFWLMNPLILDHPGRNIKLCGLSYLFQKYEFG